MWIKTSTVLEQSEVPLTHQLLLISLTFDRAALVLDVPQSWVPFDLTGPRELVDRAVPEDQKSNISRFIPGLLIRRPGERWSSFVSRSKPRSWSWLDFASAGGPMSAQAIGILAESLFSTQAHPSFPLVDQAFRDVCCQSSMAPLGTLMSQNVTGRYSIMDEAEPPRKRIRAFELAIGQQVFRLPSDLTSLRFPSHLLRSHSLRLQFLSVQISWKSFRSGIYCYGHFMDTMFPLQDHFEVSSTTIRAFASVFRNAGSFGQYLSHLRLATRLLDRSWAVPPEVVGSISRGLRKITVRHPAGTVSGSQMRLLVKHLIAAQRVDLAKFVIVAYHFMTRVQSELYPLQYDGKSVDPSSWHSVITNSRQHVCITLNRRKNSPHGDVIKRTCLCVRGDDLLCGVCCIKSLIRVHQDRASRIFNTINLQSDMSLIRRIVHTFGVAHFSWHSFRRSCAQEMLRSGCTISQIIRSGGWRSASFVQYLNRRDLDDRACLNLILQDSDHEDDP